MRRYPGSTWDPLGKQTEGRMTGHDIACMHTMVGYLSSTDEMFESGGYVGTESHFGIGGKWGGDVAKDWDGHCRQWQDLAFQADANLDGAKTVISIETADNAPKYAKDIAEWTPKQQNKIVDLLAWLCSKEAHSECPSSWTCHKEGIPPVLIPDTKPGRRGIGYHQQGCEHSDGVGSHAGFLVKGGVRWSGAVGKECPGANRIAQLKVIIIPRVKARLEGKEDVVEKADRDAIANAVVKALGPIIREEVLDLLKTEKFIRNKVLNPNDPPAANWTFEGWAAASDQKADRANAANAELAERVDAIVKDNALRLERIEAAIGKITPPAITGDPKAV